MAPGQSPSLPFFADKGAPSDQQHRKNKPLKCDPLDKLGHYINNTNEAVLARAALLQLIRRGYMIAHQWWILAAEAVRCFEQSFND